MTTVIETTFGKDRERILQVRYRVFVEEQGVPLELEQDDRDPVCRHALLVIDDRPIATGRLQPDGHIGRIAVLSAHRGMGYGRRVLSFLENVARRTGLTRVYLGAQVGAIPFYIKSGYHPYGEAFMEAGIMHRHMEKILADQSLEPDAGPRTEAKGRPRPEMIEKPAMPPPSIAYRCFRPDDLSEVLRIQEANLASNLSPARQADGFLSVAFSTEQLTDMNRDIPIVVADCGSRLGGYMSGSTVAASAGVPLLARMMSFFQETTYRGRSLDRYNAYIYGPVCVDRPLRGTGVLEGLFETTVGLLAGRFEVGVLFVSLDNPRSMRAHTHKLGMHKLRDFSFNGRDFGLLVFDCKP